MKSFRFLVLRALYIILHDIAHRHQPRAMPAPDFGAIVALRQDMRSYEAAELTFPPVRNGQ